MSSQPETEVAAVDIESIQVTEISELMNEHLLLVDVVQYAVGAERVAQDGVDSDGPAPGEPKVSLDLSARGGLGWMETRFKMVVETELAVIHSDLAVIYKFFDGAELSAEVQRDFIQKVAVMTAYPYLRESVSTSASRLGVPVPPLGVLKQGEFQVGLLADETVDSQTA